MNASGVTLGFEIFNLSSLVSHSIASLLIYIPIMKRKGADNHLLFFLVLYILYCAVKCEDNHRFPRKIWTFWEGQVNIFTKLCFNSMKHYAKRSGWQFQVLNSQYFHYNLDQKSAQIFQNIRTKGNYHTSKLADLIRSFILYSQGGIWLDASTLLIQNMSWIQNIDKELIAYNKISKEPQVICYTFNGINGGNKTIVYDQARQKQVYILPGTDNWGIVAKLKSKLFRDVIQLYRTHLLVRNESESEIIQSYVDLGYQYRLQADPYFFFGNFHFQTVIQMKQKEIDRNRGNFSTIYAVQYYEIWLIRGQQTALGYQSFFQKTKLQRYIQSLFYSYTESDAKYMKIIKFHAPSRRLSNLFIIASPYLVCSNIVPPLSTNSFIYKSALVFEESDLQHLEIIELKRLFQSPEQVCQQNSTNRKIYVFTIFVGLFHACYIINYCMSRLLLKDQKEEDNMPTSL